MSRKTTQIIIAESTRNLLRTMPIEEITVKTICKNAEIDRSTFYRYFKDKYDAVNWIYYHYCFEKLDIRDEWNIWDYYFQMAQTFYEDRVFYKNAFKYQGQNSFREYGMGTVMGIIHKDYGEVFKDEKEEKYFVTHFINIIFDDYEEWLSTTPCPSPEEHGKEFLKRFNLLIDLCSKHISNMEIMKQ